MPDNAVGGDEPISKPQEVKMTEPVQDKLPQRDAIRLESVASAYRELWAREADVSERLAAAKRSLGNIWVIASGLAAFAMIRVGRQQDDNWMVIMGCVILYFVASQTFRAWAAERDVRHESEDVARRLWEMKYKWFDLGGTESQLGALYNIWTIDPAFSSDPYREGLSKIKAEVAERIGT